MGRIKGGVIGNRIWRTDAHGMPVRTLITTGGTTDCSQAHNLIDGIDAENPLVDKGIRY